MHIAGIFLLRLAHIVKLANLNIFFAWCLIPQTLAMGWVAAVGRLILELCGIATLENANPGRLLGGFVLICTVYVIRYLMGNTLPIVGNQNGNGYSLGHRLILSANILSASLFIFQLSWHSLPNTAMVLILASFTSAFGYWVMALWAFGFSFIYQSTQIVAPPVS
jgi:hypothetical protein